MALADLMAALAASSTGQPALMADQYNTKLSPVQEVLFQRWRRSLPDRLQSMDDYDLRGAWQSNAQEASNGHLPDTFKKPNHPTFSNESIYSNQKNGVGGKWVNADASGDDKNADWLFEASPADLKYRNAGDLMDYFKKVEPDSHLILPFNYSLPQGAQ